MFESHIPDHYGFMMFTPPINSDKLYRIQQVEHTDVQRNYIVLYYDVFAKWLSERGVFQPYNSYVMQLFHEFANDWDEQGYHLRVVSDNGSAPPSYMIEKASQVFLYQKGRGYKLIKNKFE